MKVSVIIPNFNHAPYLRERIDSVLSQTLTDLEVFLLDDCSTDDSRAVMESYRHDPRVRQIIFNEHNSGNTFLQWQRGFALAQGEYLWVAESDDAAEPNFLETLVGELDRNPQAVLAYSHSRMVGSQGEPLDFTWHPKGSSGKILTYDGPWFNRHRMIVQNNVYNASMVVFRKSSLAAIPADYQQYRYCGDWLFWVGVCEQGQVIEVCRVLNRYRQHPQKVTANSQLDGRKWRDIGGILRHFITLFHLTPLQQRCLRGRWTKRFNKESRGILATSPALLDIRSTFPDLYAGTSLDIFLYEFCKPFGFLKQ